MGVTTGTDTWGSASSSPSWWGSNNGWWPLIREPFTGAWQRNQEIRVETTLAYSAVYACVTLIASDIAKMRLCLVQKDSDAIWSETESPAFSPVLTKPNRYQTRIQFFDQWIVSKLIHGNTYVLKERDDRGVVRRLYILDPTRTRPLVAPDGSVFYQLTKDALSRVEEDSISVPASEIIHDRMVPLYHPLCGVSPITACGLAALQGLSIQRNSTAFFQNNSSPGGILTAPGTINDITAQRLKEHWEQNYTGNNVGKIAVLGDGLKFERMMITAIDAQLIDQLKWTAETVASCFHVPPHKVRIGQMPNYNNIEALNQDYYSQCLQTLIESIEILIDEGLALANVADKIYGARFNLDDLLRMDTATKVKAAGDAIKAGFMKPNEARAKFDMKPVEGGDTPYLQQQNFSLAALNKRDQRDDPFGTNKPKPIPAAPAPGPNTKDVEADDAGARDFANIVLSRAKHYAPADTA